MDNLEVRLKLKMLWLYGFRNIRAWHREVWKRDAGERLCCSGYECGCYGADYYSMWEDCWKRAHLKEQAGG